MQDAVIRWYQDEGMDPQIGLAMAARESGGDDVNAIHMVNNEKGAQGMLQIMPDTAEAYGVDKLFPNWATDPYENARASAYILKKKIEEQGGDVWAGVRAYNGAGPEADAYLNQVRANYDNIGNLGNNSSIEMPDKQYYTVSDADGVNINATDLTKQKMNLLARDYYNKYGKNLWITSMKRDGDGTSWHDSGQAFDTADDVLEKDPEARKWLIEQAKKYGLYALDEYENPSPNATGGHIHFSDHGEPLQGVSLSESKGNTRRNSFWEDLQKFEDAEIPDLASSMKDTTTNAEEYDLFDNMFTADRKGRDKFIDTPENRQVIRERYQEALEEAALRRMANDVLERPAGRLDSTVAANLSNAVKTGDTGTIRTILSNMYDVNNRNLMQAEARQGREMPAEQMSQPASSPLSPLAGLKSQKGQAPYWAYCELAMPSTGVKLSPRRGERGRSLARSSLSFRVL